MRSLYLHSRPLVVRSLLLPTSNRPHHKAKCGVRLLRASQAQSRTTAPEVFDTAIRLRNTCGIRYAERAFCSAAAPGLHGTAARVHVLNDHYASASLLLVGHHSISKLLMASGGACDCDPPQSLTHPQPPIPVPRARSVPPQRADCPGEVPASGEAGAHAQEAHLWIGRDHELHSGDRGDALGG